MIRGEDHKTRRVKHRDSEIPNEYAKNEIQFCDRKFYVDRRAYITDQDACLLVREVCKIIESLSDNPVVIDVGCGSGAIGLSIAMASKRIKHLLLTDISKVALQVAKVNCTRFSVAGNLVVPTTFWESDLLKSIPDDVKYNNSYINLKDEHLILVCAPPYGSVKDVGFYSEELRKN